jgi:hypothetical protein
VRIYHPSTAEPGEKHEEDRDLIQTLDIRCRPCRGQHRRACLGNDNLLGQFGDKLEHGRELVHELGRNDA